MHLGHVQREASPRFGAKREQLRLHGFRIEVVEAAG